MTEHMLFQGTRRLDQLAINRAPASSAASTMPTPATTT
jgi:hypothetical protein